MTDDKQPCADHPSVSEPAWFAEAKADNDRWDRAQKRGQRITGALLPFYVVAVLVVLWTADSLIVLGALAVMLGFQWLLPYLNHRWYRKISINPPDELSGN